jgi:hypothetical protein
MTDKCTHPKVNVYCRLVAHATYYEPAEYEEKIVCRECGVELDELPASVVIKEQLWEEEFEE